MITACGNSEPKEGREVEMTVTMKDWLFLTENLHCSDEAQPRPTDEAMPIDQRMQLRVIAINSRIGGQ